MAKLTLTDLSTLEDQSSAIGVLNANNNLIETALENTLSRDGTSPNTMTDDIDLNSNKIINLATPTSNTDAANKAYVDTVGSSGIAGADGTDGTNGTDGNDGWTAVLAVVSDGARRVLQIVDYIGGEGTEPTTYLNFYIGLTGPVASIGSGVDIRGAQGTSGAGTGDLLAANDLSDVASAATSRTNLGLAIGTNVQAFSANLTAVAAVTVTAAGTALLDDANAAAQRTTLGLDTMATQAAGAVAITGGTITGITDLTLADGGTGASLTDPGADRILFWDDSAGAVTWLTAGSGLLISTTTMTVDVSGVKPTESLIIAVGDETTALTTGTGKVTFRMPYAFTVTAVRASLTTTSSSGVPTIDINESGTTIISTKLTIDVSEKTSTTAAVPAVISDSSLADDAEMTIDIDVAGTGAAGLKVYIIGTRT